MLSGGGLGQSGVQSKALIREVPFRKVEMVVGLFVPPWRPTAAALLAG